MSQRKLASTTPSSGIFGRIKPSYLVLFAILPLFIFLFIFNETYQSALTFILPGIYMTVALTFTSYLLAFILGLALAGGQFLKKGLRDVRTFSLAALFFLGISAVLFLLPKQDYVLVGEPEGTVAIIQGTPKNIITAVREGTYVEGAEKRNFRSVTDAATAIERIRSEDYNYTAALIPIEAVEEGMQRLWEVAVIPKARLNIIVFLFGLGIMIALLAFASSQSEEHPLAIFSELYIDIVRGIPMIVLIVFIGFVLTGALAELGVLIEPSNPFLRNLQRGTIAIGTIYAAYMAEIFRAGVEAVPKGQMEAAKSLGLSNWQAIRRVILPQAIKIVIPPLGNDFIAMFKDTALISVIGTPDLFKLAREVGAAKFNNIPPFSTVAVIYIMLTLGASGVLKWLERKTDTAER